MSIKLKKQLIEISVKSLADEIDFSGDVGLKLIVNGQNPTPMEISAGGLVIFRQDLQNFHEEADEIIVAHAIYAATVESKNVQVVADDTDIYIMLLYHYYTNSIETPMTPTRCGRTVIDIKATVEQLGEMCLDILPAHALTGCAPVPMLHGIGKLIMLKTLKEHKHSLSLIGDLSADFGDVVSQATKFIGSCYGIHSAISMTDVRVKSWIKKTGRKTATKVPKLSSLPPTSEAFQQNVKRAHLQSAIWKAALRDPPCVDPVDFGWERVEETRTLRPIGLPASEQSAPEYIMKIVYCS